MWSQFRGLAITAVVALAMVACGGGHGGGRHNQSPSASFTVTPTAGSAPLPVAFDATASSDVDGWITAYAWNYGDGTEVGFGVTTSHTFATPGTFTVTLTVTDNLGATASVSRSITTVANTAPTASFTGTPASGTVPLEVSFDASASSDAEGPIVNFDWSFGDGSIGSGVRVAHTYAAYVSPGNVEVRLTVTDSRGDTGVAIQSIRLVPRYRLVDLGILDSGVGLRGFGINDSGHVVGESLLQGAVHAFLYTEGALTDLGTLDGRLSSARDINNVGQVVGECGDPVRKIWAPCIFQDGVIALLCPPGDLVPACVYGGIANGVNEAGDVVGELAEAAFLWRGGSLTLLGDMGSGSKSRAIGINEGRQIVGAIDTYAALWSGDTVMVISSDHATQANAINAGGSIVGWSYFSTPSTPSTSPHAFLYHSDPDMPLAGRILDLGVLGVGHSVAHAINDAAEIVGWSQTSVEPFVSHAFLYKHGKMYDLNELLEVPSTNVLTEATAISNRGQIAANSCRNDDRYGQPVCRAFILIPIEEAPAR